MILDRTRMDATMKLSKLTPSMWNTVSDSTKDRVITECQELLNQLPMITKIEGVTNISGAKYALETTITKTLELLGAPISEETIGELALANFLTVMSGPPVTRNPAPTEPAADFPF